MKSNIGAGIVCGLIAGVVMGFLMSVISVPNPAGEQQLMMEMVAGVVGSTSLFTGWLYHLFNSAVIGAIFGVIFSSKATTIKNGSAYGAIYGAFWWVLGGLVLMPAFLGAPVFGPLTMPGMQIMAFMSLVGHLVYGVILGITYTRFHKIDVISSKSDYKDYPKAAA